MLIVNGIVLFLVAFVGGILAYYFIGLRKREISSWLNFAGGYLFSITIVHLLPELFQSEKTVFTLSVIVLVGFFLQQILEILSSGVEHGHMHTFNKAHSHSKKAVLVVMVSLFVHALLEGSIIAEDPHESISLLLSIALHKVPAAIALVSILICHLTTRTSIFSLLFIFAIASPLGILLSNYFVEPGYYEYAFALVCGSFLQISTTIVFESNADHKFNSKKLFWSLIGSVMAVLTSYL